MIETVLIPGWSKFQRYKDRRPAWICNHVELLHRDAYLGLSLADRGFLHGLWMLAAEDPDNLKRSAACISVARLKASLTPPRGYTQKALVRLNHAGFIELCAPKSALSYGAQKAETEKALKPFSGSKVNESAAPNPVDAGSAQWVVSMQTYRDNLNRRHA